MDRTAACEQSTRLQQTHLAAYCSHKLSSQKRSRFIYSSADFSLPPHHIINKKQPGERRKKRKGDLFFRDCFRTNTNCLLSEFDVLHGTCTQDQKARVQQSFLSGLKQAKRSQDDVLGFSMFNTQPRQTGSLQVKPLPYRPAHRYHFQQAPPVQKFLQDPRRKRRKKKYIK